MDMRDIPGLIQRLDALKGDIEALTGGTPVVRDGEAPAIDPEHAEKIDRAIAAIESMFSDVENLKAFAETGATDIADIKQQLSDATASFNRISEHLEALRAAPESTEQPQG